MRKKRPQESLRSAQRGELLLLSQIRRRAAKLPGRLRLGIGDDCALLQPLEDEEVAVTTDLSVESRHFRLDWHPAESVGHRALARGLSDLAAMGARPLAAFLSLGLPRELTAAAGRGTSQKGNGRAWISRFFDGLLALAAAHKTPLAGGDLAESPIALCDIVLVGAVPAGKALLRSGARAGDAIYVTGTLGGSAAGLARLRELGETDRTGRKQGTKALRLPARLGALLAPHLYPQPRLAQGLWLQKHGAASAAIDLSDGLSTDLNHICEESGVAAEIDAAWLPLSPGASLAQALHGGEDYELLFTAPEGTRMPRAIAGVAVTPIGRVLGRSRGRARVTLLTAEGRLPLTAHGWEHFS